MDFRRFNLLPIVLLVLLLFLQYRLWFEAGGVFDLFHLKKQLVLEQQFNEKLKKRNQAVLIQVQHLQENQEAIEARARQELGMIKQGETFYQVISGGSR